MARFFRRRDIRVSATGETSLFYGQKPHVANQCYVSKEQDMIVYSNKFWSVPAVFLDRYPRSQPSMNRKLLFEHGNTFIFSEVLVYTRGC